ncbi:cardiolipin synthase [Suttonella ornithocola]|uniref:Cardiolipin synthase n=1 Tax=Suttonella ornithocola TaxID=279832 RepID=A0A380MP97_9GAMM|nr:cardiolipin synthase [Suttonella ornithocola]SUO93107.1 Cardiolipin synthase [Suttonella ornithocola]
MHWLLICHLTIVFLFMLRIALREDLRPDARMAWFMTLLLTPALGCILYFLFGSARMARKVRHYHHQVLENTKRQFIQALGTNFLGSKRVLIETLPNHYQSAFQYLASINHLYPVTGNCAELMADGKVARKRLLQDIEAAKEQVNVLYYIWLNDETGQSVAQALIRAAKRGVSCRAVVDGLGSRAFLKTELWQELQAAGVQTAVALPINHWWTIFQRRIDLRNHRKITLIDGKIVYCGSQNCADEAFVVKAKYAPWVDIMLRLEGPIVTQTQLLFAADWQLASGEAELAIPTKAAEHLSSGFTAQVMGDGPTARSRSTAEFLSTLISTSQETIIISTPYFVPDATVLDALCAAAWRGVEVTLIVPKRNDSWIVSAVSRSHYRRLLEAGIKLYEFRDGLLHAKTLTIDEKITFIGSTNLDLRSFDLNYENNVLLSDEKVTQAVLERQLYYRSRSDLVELKAVLAWSVPRKIWNNLLATISPIL